MDSIVSDSYAVHFNESAYKALNDYLAKTGYSIIFVLVDEKRQIRGVYDGIDEDEIHRLIKDIKVLID